MQSPCSSRKDRRFPVIRRQPNHELIFSVERVGKDELAFHVGTRAVKHTFGGVEWKLEREPCAR
eukprot:3982625-Pleurochrysis_carterae.AAC.1